MAAKEYIS